MAICQLKPPYCDHIAVINLLLLGWLSKNWKKYFLSQKNKVGLNTKKSKLKS